MGIYLNPTNEKFQRSLNSEIYVDKSELIGYTNSVLGTNQQYLCVSRPRRFGKSMALDMLAAYYGRFNDSNRQFEKLKISQKEGYRRHLNQYNVISINMQEFLSNSGNVDEMLTMLKKRLLFDIRAQYPDVVLFDENNLTFTLQDIFNQEKIPFVILIDEWDCIFREKKGAEQEQKQYLDFLRDWLKDKSYTALVYMTGILPIKKYGSHSALNMFLEFSMTNPREMEEYVGFTEAEVRQLCEKYNRSFADMKAWYDGYSFLQVKSVYNPKAVVEATLSGVFDSYWTKTETYEALRSYIEMNYAGLKDMVTRMLAGDRQHINTGRFCNDMTTFENADDVLTLLVHLGYLAYDFEKEEVYIPNREISKEFYNAIEGAGWSEVVTAIRNSKNLLEAIWNMDAEYVAEGIENAHFETSILQYNDENALSYTLSLALYAARQYYTVVRECPAGKGFADLVFLPTPKHANKPALLVELKWNCSVDAAIEQIKEKNYPKSLQSYEGNIMLVSVNYDKKTKKHECVIEKVQRLINGNIIK
ncbi:MAG: AAA family ATPase [Lachnospiraceae bacterium]